jgi:hypothetical protein
MIIHHEQRPWFRLGVCLAAGLTVAWAGCGGASKATVSGTVTYKGEPLPAGMIAFLGKDNQVASGSIESNGHYSVRGVPVGPVKISISPPPTPLQDSPPPEGMPTVKTFSIPDNYKDPETSGLTLTVKPGSQEHPIDLK